MNENVCQDCGAVFSNGIAHRCERLQFHMPLRRSGAPATRIKRPEQAMQIALLQWAEIVQVGQHTLAEWLTHIPNGGARTPFEGAILKAMGTKAGMPDLILPIRTTVYAAGYWELKAGNEKPSEVQIERHAMLRAGGSYVTIARRWDEAARDMLRYLERGPFTVVCRGRL